MTITELLESSDPMTRTRGLLLSEKDLHNWVNLQLGRQVEGVDSATAVLDFSEITDVTLDGKAKVTVMIPNYEEKHLSLLSSLFGEPQSCGSNKICDWFDWSLTIEDWPFLTVEVVAESLRDLANYGKLTFTDTPEIYLQRYFPKASYAQLVDWYTSGLFALDDFGEGLPLLRDILEQYDSSVSLNHLSLPADVY